MPKIHNKLLPCWPKQFAKHSSSQRKELKQKIPIFLAHGAHDVRSTVLESEQMAAALKKRGIEHKYISFPDEGHYFKNTPTKLILYAEIEKFLSKHLHCASMA